jgi:Predicted membrane protein
MNWSEYLENYKRSHLHPVNRGLHAFGIPMIVISLPIFFWNWRLGLILFTLGWIFQFVGHAIEGKPPAFLKNPAYLLVGPYWWIKDRILKSRSGARL